MSKFTNLFDPRMLLFDFVKFSGGIPVVIGQRLKKVYVNGKKPKKLYRGRLILSSNHSTFRDPLVLFNALWMRRIRFLATKEITDMPFWGKFFRACGCIRVDRDNLSIETMKEAKKTIDKGHVIGIFPEGHVSEDFSIKAFKNGTVMLSLMNKADILPIYICKKKKKLSRQIVIIGERISFKAKGNIPSRDEVEEMTNILYKKELELMEIAKRIENGK